MIAGVIASLLYIQFHMIALYDRKEEGVGFP
jgi:hypothetical protein